MDINIPLDKIKIVERGVNFLFDTNPSGDIVDYAFFYKFRCPKKGEENNNRILVMFF